MPRRTRPIEKFAEAVAKCSAEASVYGKCIAADFNGVYKDKCLIEFLKLKDCYTEYPHGNSLLTLSTRRKALRILLPTPNVQLQNQALCLAEENTMTAPTVASDNAIESGENKIASAPKGDSDEPVSTGVDRSGKAAPLPEGISELENKPGSGGGSQGFTPGGGGKTTGGGSGKGGKDEPYVDRVAEDLKGGN